MSSKKITMDYDEYLKDIEKLEEGLSEKFFNAGLCSEIEMLFDYTTDEGSLDIEIDYIKEVINDDKELDEDITESRRNYMIRKLKILCLLRDGLKK